MAQLRWDQVAAPNLNGGITGIESANRMIGGGLGDMATALSQFGDRQALEQLSRYTDAQKLQQDLQTGAFNTGNASSEALKTIMGRPSALISNTYNQQTVDHNAVMNPLNQQFKQLQIQGGQMDLANQAVMDPLRQADAQLRTHQNYLGHTRSEADRAMDLAMGQQWDAYKRNNMLTPEAATAFVDQYSADPVAHAKARAMVAGEMPSYGQAIVSPSLGSIPGAEGIQVSPAGTAGTSQGSPYDVVYGYGEYGTPPKPLTQSTLGEVVDFGKGVLIPNTKGKLPNQPANIGTSAVGKYQFTQGTLDEYGPKVFGSNWKSTLFTPENQDKLAEALFHDRKNGNLKATWEGLPDTREGAYKDVPWEQMKQIIERVESKTALSGQQAEAVAKQANQENTVVQQAVQAADMFGDTSTANRALTAYSQDPRGLKSAQEMAVAMTGEGGALRGVDINDTRQAIEQVVTELGVSPAVASSIVQESVGEGGILGVGAGRLWFDKQVIDFDKLEAKLDSIGGKRVNGKYENHGKFNTVLDTMIKNTATQNAQQNLESTNQEIAAIVNRIRQLEQIGSPAAQQAIAVETQRLNQARALQQQALQGGQGIISGLLGNTAPSAPAPVTAPPPPAPVATQPATPVGTVSSGSGNSNAVRGLDYSAAQRYWENQNQQNARAHEEQSLAEAARKAQEAKAEMDRRIAAAKRMREMFPETPFLAY